MSFIDIAQQLLENVSDEGQINDETSNLLFSSFNDSNVWSPIDIDCAMPKSSFYHAKINSKLSPISVNSNDSDQGDHVYLVVRYTQDDITKYLEYLQFEYNSYLEMEDQTKEMIAPIGYVQSISQEGFLFAFLTSTNHTLDGAINTIKDMPIEKKFTYIINLINIVKNYISGFHITPKTILINEEKDEESIGLIGLIGSIESLQSCPTAKQFSYNNEFSASELKKSLKPTIRAPNSVSDVYGLAKVIQFIIGEDFTIPVYKKVMASALQKNKDDRLSLDDFKAQMLYVQNEIASLEDDKSTPNQPSTVEEKTTNRLIDKILNQCTKLKTEEGCPQIYELPFIETKKYAPKKLRKITVGQQKNSTKNEVKILIVGSTGSGKTTFLNGISNFLYGVEWEDACRFKIVREGSDGNKKVANNQAISQTDYVTAYTFYWEPEFPVDFTVTLIDTPGFGDTRGIEQDRLIVQQIEALFRNEGNCGIDSLNAVAFVVQSAIPRLGAAQKYIFDQIQQLFGNDIKDNFIIVATFADAGEPKVMASIKEANIPANYVSKFNNSALFSKIDGEDGYINKLFWEIGQRGYSHIFASVAKITPKSLVLTQNVLKERNKLYSTIEHINRKINEGIDKMGQIQQRKDMIEKYKTQIERNKKFTYTNYRDEIVTEKLPQGQYVTNCTICNNTCHERCYIPEDSRKSGCSVMDSNGYCTKCEKKCHWSHHRNHPYKFVVKRVAFTETSEDLKRKYGDALSGKQSAESWLNNLQKEYDQISQQTSDFVTECASCIERLQKIALKPITLSEVDYIDLQIQTEKSKKNPNMNKIKKLQELLDKHKLMVRVIKKEKLLGT